MLNICSGSSKGFNKIIHNLLDLTVQHFLEVGSNLEYEEILGSVFPSHRQGDQEFGMKILNKIYRDINDNFVHQLTPFEEYVLYHILDFVYESSEDGFCLKDSVKTFYSKIGDGKLSIDELRLLTIIRTPEDLKGVCFEDIDFLDIGEIFELYKTNPEFVNGFLHIDLEDFIDLMPEDILLEFENIKTDLQKEDTEIEKIKGNVNDKENFYEIVGQLIRRFNRYVVHNKVSTVLNNKLGEMSEKGIQVIFYMYANEFLKPYDIVIQRELDTGRGIVDFHLSQGREFQALLEFKLDSNRNVVEGINYQLPIYLISQEIEYGVFILICYSEKSYNDSKKFCDDAQKASEKYQKRVNFYSIDASAKAKTGSNIKTDEEMRLKDQ
ncbi:hypothetical protein P4797_15115 [Priestia aryabhattai]|uniref:hypothetical protein n=1 Tax=Priestia aryabhattai TaxID=412384 RepID=UPI002E20D16B|nr:hypothetical protein [Priestia aryabhattai]